jgi:hypothetical protein
MKKGKEQKIHLPLVPQMDSVSKYIDPFGSYTGVAAERMEVPVQDVDDL